MKVTYWIRRRVDGQESNLAATGVPCVYYSERDAAGESFVAIPVEVEIPDPPKPFEWAGRKFIVVSSEGAVPGSDGTAFPPIYSIAPKAVAPGLRFVEVEITIREVPRA